MSEYSSLYIKIKISKEKLQAFFQEKTVLQTANDNWIDWWASREMYGKQPLEQLPYYYLQNNRAIFDHLLKDKRSGSVEHYDLASQSWTFISVFFGENYTEILPMLSLLKNLAIYQEAEETGVAFIYDFHWGSNQVMAYLAFANRQALFENYVSPSEIEPQILQLANHALQAAIEKFNQQYND